MSLSRPAVLLDCDPGIDDCLALMYLAGLHHAGEIELVGVSTTAGNVAVQQTAANARWILDLCGLPEVPVAPGRPDPLEVQLTTTPETHGESGLGYLSAPRHDFGDMQWQELWSTAIARNPGLHLIITGPVTNLADFEREHGDAVARCGSLTIMGGAVNYRGNTTPTAEWNFWVDPTRQHVIFQPQKNWTVRCARSRSPSNFSSPQSAWQKFKGFLVHTRWRKNCRRSCGSTSSSIKRKKKAIKPRSMTF